jgi:ADP-ribose pyrophosphatase YjhB (NUDIX family)
MNDKSPKVSVDILITRGDQILLGLLTQQWNLDGKQVYGVPGREIRFGEKMGEAVKRNLKEEIDCELVSFAVICVNANYAYGNHYVGIGVKAEINGEPKNILPQDWEKWEWFDKDKLPENLFPAARNLIDCFLKNKFNVCE